MEGVGVTTAGGSSRAEIRRVRLRYGNEGGYAGNLLVCTNSLSPKQMGYSGSTYIKKTTGIMRHWPASIP